MFTRYLFALPLRSADAESFAKALTSIFFRHAYLPKTILTDLGTVFTANLIRNLTKMLGIQLKHATLKHPQTIGLLKRSHASFKRALKENENQLSSDWYNYVDVATFAHNTTYHKAIGCPPSLFLHGREPHFSVDLRFKTSAETQVIIILSTYPNCTTECHSFLLILGRISLLLITKIENCMSGNVPRHHFSCTLFAYFWILKFLTQTRLLKNKRVSGCLYIEWRNY